MPCLGLYPYRAHCPFFQLTYISYAAIVISTITSIEVDSTYIFFLLSRATSLSYVTHQSSIYNATDIFIRSRKNVISMLLSNGESTATTWRASLMTSATT